MFKEPIQIDFLSLAQESWIPESLRVSPDGNRSAYVTRRGEQLLVCVDGLVISKGYDGIMQGTPIFSPDSTRVAYAARVRDEQFGRKWCVVVDEKEGVLYDGIIADSLIFSPDSKQVAYAAKQGANLFVVVDEKEGKKYDSIMRGTPIFTPDSTRVAYAARVKDKWFVVVDEKEQKQYDAIAPGTLTFSPNSKRIAYVAIVGSKPHALQKSRLDPVLDYAATGYKWFMVVDGKEQQQYDAILEVKYEGTPIFEMPYFILNTGTPIFSRDSKRVACVTGFGDELLMRLWWAISSLWSWMENSGNNTMI